MSNFALKNTLRRIAEKVRRAHEIQQSGGRLAGEDWAELQQLSNEAFDVLESHDEHEDVGNAGGGAPPEFFAVLRMDDHTEVTGFDDEDEAETYLEDRLAQIDQTHEVYFEDVLPFRVFASAEFAATFKGYRDSAAGAKPVNTTRALLKKMRALTALDSAMALPLAALCQTDPGGVTRLVTEKYYSFDVGGDRAIFTNSIRDRIEAALDVRLQEVVYPGYEGETALAFPERLADVAKAYLEEVERDTGLPKMKG